jgi:hypothetical protein
MTERRQFIRLVGGGAGQLCRSPRAQQPALPLIGFVNGGSADPAADRVRALADSKGGDGITSGEWEDK